MPERTKPGSPQASGQAIPVRRTCTQLRAHGRRTDDPCAHHVTVDAGSIASDGSPRSTTADRGDATPRATGALLECAASRPRQAATPTGPATRAGAHAPFASAPSCRPAAPFVAGHRSRAVRRPGTTAGARVTKPTTEPSSSGWAGAVTIRGGRGAPARARRHVLSQLDGEVSETRAADAALVVSELVTNSVVHAAVGDDQSLWVELATVDDHLRIAVVDPGSELEPRILPPDPMNDGGLGLVLVDRLCSTWGVVHNTAGTTRVWCDLPLDRAPFLLPRTRPVRQGMPSSPLPNYRRRQGELLKTTRERAEENRLARLELARAGREWFSGDPADDG
ncbi:MAG: ATP-binding protein [Solirubrobacteraceae bacterium]